MSKIFTVESFKEICSYEFKRAYSQTQFKNKNIIEDKNWYYNQLEKLAEKIKNNNYNTDSYDEYFIIKDNRTNLTRRVISFNFQDNFLYYYLVFNLQDEIAENRVKNTFGGFRLDHKVRDAEKLENNNLNNQEYESLEFDGCYNFFVTNKINWIKAYGEFSAILKKTSEDEYYQYVLELDIANFYDNINISILENYIRYKVDKSKSQILSLLFYFLRFWDKKTNFYSAKTCGIPQDIMGESSRLLANFYLQEYDEYIFNKCENMNI